jgi:hypothetical protein
MANTRLSIIIVYMCAHTHTLAGFRIGSFSFRMRCFNKHPMIVTVTVTVTPEYTNRVTSWHNVCAHTHANT